MTAVAAVLLLALVLVFAKGCRARHSAPSYPLPQLNTILTNEMSDTSVLAPMDKSIEKFMRQYNIQGMSLSIMRNDSLLYSKGYGWADEEKDQKMTPGTILRMASASKLLTAVGIMVLKEQGLLSLDDKVFGPDGILSDSIYNNVIKDRNYYRITVEQLLRHQGGFTTRGGDPMFTTRDIIRVNKLESAPDHRTLLQCVLPRRLGFVPGTSQSYSNFGYLLLSMIIEKVTGEDYEDWMQENVLKPAGCYDMHIAENYYHLKRPNESRYHMQKNDTMVPEFNDSGDSVVRCYGGNDIKALAGAGAWVASTAELARFVASIDGRPEVPDIISKESVDEMIEYFDKETFSLGWNDTEPESGWTRTGTFSGTSALIKYYPDGECWILITNTGTWLGPRFSNRTTALFKDSRAKYSALLPARNLFRGTD